MARPELGTKRVCPTTGRKFYDMNRDPIVSPYTGDSFARSTFEPQIASRGSAATAAADPDEEVEVDTDAAGPEIVSLETVGEAEEAGAEGAEEVVAEDDVAVDDTFLEEEEEGGDVSDLIDGGDIEDDEES